MDDPLEQAAFTQWQQDDQGRRWGVSALRVSGMWCAACADTIEQVLKSQAGVLDARVVSSTARAEVRWDPTQTRPSRWVAAVKAAGYGAVPDEAVAAFESRKAQARQMHWRLFVAAMGMMQVMMLAAPTYWSSTGEIPDDQLRILHWGAWLLSLPVLIFSSGPFFQGAWAGLKRRQIRMDLPIALGIAVTFGVSMVACFDPQGPFGSAVYFDSMTMFVCFLLAGRTLELHARHRVARVLEGHVDQLPRAVERALPGGAWDWVSPRLLRLGDTVRVPVGAALPCDGRVLAGHSEVDEALMTGESRPVSKSVDSRVMAGSLNLTAPLTVEVTRLGADTQWAQVQDLMRQALQERPLFAPTVQRVAGPFLWGVLMLALGAGGVWWWIDPSRVWWVVVSVLIVTCPCALGLATPAAVLAAASGLARRGLLMRHLGALETLAGVDTVVLDKTGTITLPGLSVDAVQVNPDAGWTPAAAQSLLVSLAEQSQHPVSRALVAWCAAQPNAPAPGLPTTWRTVQEHAGLGLEAQHEDGRIWRLGRPQWVAALSARAGEGVPAVPGDVALGHTDHWVWCADRVEALRPDAAQALQALRDRGLAVHLFTGDTAARAQAVAQSLPPMAIRADLQPEDKLQGVVALQAQGRRVLMVGDGLNDAPVLARSDVSLAFFHGAGLSQHHADGLVMGQRLSLVIDILVMSERTKRVIRQNMAWSVFYNLSCIPLALAGYLPPWAAGLGMALSSLGVVLNALRLGR